MNLLAIGDVTSPGGLDYLCRRLWETRREYAVDFCIVNAENASFISGIGKDAAEKLLLSGADVISGGNHTMQNFTAHKMLDELDGVIRPINYPKGAPGVGSAVIDTGRYRVLAINAMGCVHIDPQLDAPYDYIERALEDARGRYDFAVLDIHAEATGEKLAIAHTFDGKINVIFGTHTHVPTADTSVLPKGTGYVTDVGMCGESGGILGMETESVLVKLRSKLPGKFKCASGEPYADAVLFVVDDGDGRVREVRRIRI